MTVRLVVHVHPAARRTEVGGRYGSAEPPVLIIRVQAPASEGKANDAVIGALAQAFHLDRTRVRIVAGNQSRTKLVEADGADPAVLAELLNKRKPPDRPR